MKKKETKQKCQETYSITPKSHIGKMRKTSHRVGDL
jgi:hypothetical protein